MRFVTAEEMRGLDQLAGSKHGIVGAALMRRAGLAVAESVRRVALASGVSDLPVVLVAGRGNNGGDVHAAAAFLLSWGFRAQVRLAAEPSRIAGDARIFLDALPTGLVEDWSSPERWDADDPRMFPRGTLFVDGVLGTGANGAPRGTAAAAIRWLRHATEVGKIVAVDLPSGMDADSGVCAEPHVVADVTVCLALPKTGLRSPAALAACGRVEVADIGFSAALNGEPESDGWGWIGESELRSLAPGRPRTAHKGVFGHALVVGGSLGYSGAVALAAGGALRSGAGLVSVWTPSAVAGAVAAYVPEAMVRALGDDVLGCQALRDSGSSLGAFDAVVLGPGLSQRPGTRELVDTSLSSSVRRLVLDADALNLIDGDSGRLREVGSKLVLTPHPGEAGRLLGIPASAVQANRPAALRALVERTGATVVLKGAGTMVGTPGRGVHLLMGGNPGMATGGTGDVLAGLLGGLLAQGMEPFDAARLAVWWHAAAGDLAAWRGCEAALVAGDLLRCLPEAGRWIMAGGGEREVISHQCQLAIAAPLRHPSALQLG